MHAAELGFRPRVVVICGARLARAGPFRPTCPACRYGPVMTRVVVDPPTLLHLVAGAEPVGAEHRLVAPQALRSQALALLFDAVRRGELTEAGARARHEALTAVKVRLLGDRVSRWTAWGIARDHGVDLADAEYLAVTRLQADVFVSVDAAAQARAEGIVPVGGVELLH